MRTFIFFSLGALVAVMPGLCAPTDERLKQQAGKYQVTLRLPADGLAAGEEMALEFHIADMSQVDPVLGATPLIRADVQASIGMPAMPGMPKFQEKAHAEGVPGDYGIHPTFAHGGDYQLHLVVQTQIDRPFTVDFPLSVDDANASKSRKKSPPAYRLELLASPRTPKAGEPTDIELTVRGRDHPKEAIREFDVAHERLVHLLIVRHDLGTFAHEHPILSPDGTFRIRYTFPTSGEYHLFADVAPKGAGSQILIGKLKVSGTPGERFEITKAERSDAPVRAGNLMVKLETIGPIPARKTVVIRFKLTDAATGQAPAGMEPYLGAMGHLMMVGVGASTFVHAHPDEDPAVSAPDSVSFLARMPKPGLYRAWAQFQRNGTVQTASFIIEAR